MCKMNNTIIGTGTDIESIARFRGMKRNRDKSFLKRIYAKAELDYCFSKKDPAQHLAVRFAAKEAVIKALHHLPNFKALPLSKIEIERSENGAPRVTLPKTFKSLKIYLSMSHCGEYALAFVVVEKIIE